jgi:Peroxiredoxin
MTSLKEGDTAPDFIGISTEGKEISLSELIKNNKFVVLYFYPKDFTSGCTKEACSFRDNFSLISSLGAQVVGVSLDDPKTHSEFAREYGLNFILISDLDGKISEKYGVLRSMGKRKFAARTTFIIDSNGKIVKIFRNVNPNAHGKEVYEFLSNILNKA